MLVQLIADYGASDLAFAEVIQQIAQRLPQAQVHATAVPAFDTISAGFCVAQLALTGGPSDRLIVHNVAPRRDDLTPRSSNAGERFCAGRTRAGVLVVGPNSGYSFAFCASELAGLHYLSLPADGSQFRSRDVLPDALPRLLDGDLGVLAEPVPAALVPPVPESSVAFSDSYGNVKTTIPQLPGPSGARVDVKVGAISATATISDGSFAVAEGELALAPGSSGWATASGGKHRFCELFLRGGSAAALFGNPPAGARIVLHHG